jgi:hypothetical protein
MEKKYCKKCETWKDIVEFSKKKAAKDGLHSICKICSRQNSKNDYIRKPAYYKSKAKLSRKSQTVINQNYVVDYLKTHPCVDCKNDDFMVLTFDHMRDKHKDVSVLIINGASLETLKNEIAKCEVRCANCHLKKTIKTFGFWKNNY